MNNMASVPALSSSTILQPGTGMQNNNNSNKDILLPAQQPIYRGEFPDRMFDLSSAKEQGELFKLLANYLFFQCLSMVSPDTGEHKRIIGKVAKTIIEDILKRGVTRVFMQAAQRGGEVWINGNFTSSVINKYGEGGNAIGLSGETPMGIAIFSINIPSIRGAFEIDSSISKSVTGASQHDNELTYTVRFPNSELSLTIQVSLMRFLQQSGKEERDLADSRSTRVGQSIDLSTNLISDLVGNALSSELNEKFRRIFGKITVVQGSISELSCGQKRDGYVQLLIKKVGEFRKRYFVDHKRWIIPSVEDDIDLDRYDLSAVLAAIFDSNGRLFSSYRVVRMEMQEPSGDVGTSAETFDGRKKMWERVDCLATRDLNQGIDNTTVSTVEMLASLREDLSQRIMQSLQNGRVGTIERLAVPNFLADSYYSDILFRDGSLVKENLKILQLFILLFTLAQIGTYVSSKFDFLIVQSDDEFTSILTFFLGPGIEVIGKIVQTKKSREEVALGGKHQLENDNCNTAILDVKKFLSFVESSDMLKGLWQMYTELDRYANQKNE